MVVAVGITAIFAAMFHLFDGPHTAREIGFLLAAVIAVSISYLGDAYGHLHQEAVHDNHAPDNTGLLLWSDFTTPLVAITLYAAWQRFRRLKHNV